MTQPNTMDAAREGAGYKVDVSRGERIGRVSSESSVLFRTINASISSLLASEFGLGAAETGLLASVYFLIFAGARIPIGVLLDR